MTGSPNTSLPPAIFLMGPTASGKTALAIELIERFPCEIISVDSALVYQGMDIGTAKPDADMLAKAPHRLIDIRDPAEPYSAADFRADALREMADIQAQGKVPLLVGGTMMYFKFLRDGAAELPKADDQIRNDILQMANEKGWPFVHQELAKVDPESAERLNPNDAQRIHRALEVYRISGRPIVDFWREQEDQAIPYDVINLAVIPSDRKALHQRIEQRFRQMLDEGFIDEVRNLFQRGDLNKDLPSIRAVGYRQVWEYLEGDLSYDEMLDRGVIATRQLAKRQITWLRSWPNLHWLETEDPELVDKALKILVDAHIVGGKA